LQGDRGYDSGPVRQLLRWLGITPVLAERNTEHGSGLGVFRWFVERSISWLHSFGRLRRRLDRLTEIQEAFLRLACSLSLEWQETRRGTTARQHKRATIADRQRRNRAARTSRQRRRRHRSLPKADENRRASKRSP
jgi:hypothetical protein